MTKYNLILKDLLFIFKDLINVKLFNILTNPNYDIYHMDYNTLKEFVSLIFKDAYILYIIYIDLSKMEETNYLLTPDQILEDSEKNEYLLKYSRLFTKSLRFRDLNLPNNNKLYLDKYLELRVLMYKFIELYYISDKLLNKNYIFSEESKLDSISYIKKAFAKDKDSKFNNLNNSVIDKKIILGLKNNILYKNIGDCAILVKFSDPQFVLNKKQKSLNLIHGEYAKYTGHFNLPEYQNKINTDNINNTRENISVIASITFINLKIIDEILYNTVYSNIRDTDQEHNLYSFFCNLYIKNIFIIDPKYKYGPTFFSPFNSHFLKNLEFININHFNLEDFSLYFATLHKEKINYRKVKLDLFDGININKDFSIDSNHLYKYFHKFTDLNQSIFIFKNCNWSTILENLYKYGVEVSGGSTVKRHIVSPIDFSLSIFLNAVSLNGYKDAVISTHFLNKSLYESKFSKNIKNIYNKNLLRDRILYKINTSHPLNFGYRNIDLVNVDKAKKDENLELLYNIKYFILNNWLIRFDYLNEYLAFNNVGS